MKILSKLNKRLLNKKIKVIGLSEIRIDLVNLSIMIFDILYSNIYSVKAIK
jgi:hypothetical protein